MTSKDCQLPTADCHSLSEYDYYLPDELIAQRPLPERDASRMLVLNRAKQTWHDGHFVEFASFARPGDLVVMNNTRVFPARLVGRREPSGGRVELFLLKELEPSVWEVLARPARRLQRKERVSFGNGELRATVEDHSEDGRRIVRFECEDSFEAVLDALGQTPLPPYIKRGDEELVEDRERYQTVYARRRGAVAAPTAGLHFTPRVLDELGTIGASTVEITLHVGYGTFEPVRVTNVNEHAVASERYEITTEAAQAINETRARGNRILAIGTSTTRALESAADEEGFVAPGNGEARLTIIPGYRFRIVDALLTNFHLPRSSLLILVAAFAGRELVLSAYAHAVEERYRFYSYGDCMLII